MSNYLMLTFFGAKIAKYAKKTNVINLFQLGISCNQFKFGNDCSVTNTTGTRDLLERKSIIVTKATKKDETLTSIIFGYRF